MRVALALSMLLALLSSLWVWFPKNAAVEGDAEKTGALLTADGEALEPERVASLQVEQWDATAKAPSLFAVAKKGGQWVIPSHHDYPADGGTKVGETAGGVMNVPRGPLVSASADQHADFGVLDPRKDGTLDDEARGKRVTLKDEGGATLVDLIVGKAKSQPDIRYVREFGKDEVYTAKVNVNISTSFKDWVETDFLKLNRADIRRLTVKDYSVDETKGVIKERTTTPLLKAKDATAWTSPRTPAEQQVDEDTVEKLLSEATGLRLAGVRPFDPEWLQARGFFVAQQGQQVTLKGNEGELEIGTKDGVNYFLFFGEIAVDDEQDQAAGGKPAGEAEKKEDGKGHNRYMAVFASYDPKLDEDVKASAEGQKTGAETEPKKDEKAAGLAKAEKAQQRFQQFFYVIGNESFEKLRPAAEKLFKSKEVKKENLPGEAVPENESLQKKEQDLQYAEIKKGEGAEALEGDTVEVHYTGWLLKDKSEFDSSSGRSEAFKFTIGKGEVIKGWELGVQGMKVGGKRKLVIPHPLGYGDAGSPPKIPAKADLVFDVELLKIAGKAADKPRAEVKQADPAPVAAPAEAAKTEPAENKTEAKTDAAPKE
ncbi:MAG: FKBP-type peptidyl-prolyl cis-trans isomerase [Planctomycetes bacterium]|nr:FKBP-type peptidyl-prolyl cis-trans isomerase [Planctomycetota bacterium]